MTVGGDAGHGVEGATLVLRRMRRDDLPFFTDEETKSAFDDFGFSWFHRLAEQFDRPQPATDPTRFVVETKAGEVVGMVSWHWVSYGPNDESRGVNIGITLRVAARGKGYGTEAQRLLADHLFATTNTFRVEASTDVENIAEQRALEKAGFTREGVLRAAQMRSGVRHDIVVYSRLRTD
ncbi:MAG: GNAT family N-acetyltransferase [Actinomycetota bacterium]|nr:GNAT family N-acetyltransferase [Actinomycetota bacterium]